jgi:hypothetical protein
VAEGGHLAVRGVVHGGAANGEGHAGLVPGVPLRPCACTREVLGSSEPHDRSIDVCSTDADNC